jgi:hypothetical protein
MRRLLDVAVAGLAFLGATPVAQASPIDVTYTVSGSAGSWIYDFSITNSLGGTNDIYFFGVEMSPLGARNIVGSPSNWDPNAQTGWNNSIHGGLNINYDNIWIDGNYPTSILPGQTLSGFKTGSTASTSLSSVRWFAWSANPDGGTYTGSFCNINCGAPFTNPGFEYGAIAAVPDPSTMWLVGTGVVGLSGRRWLRRTPTV